MKKFLSMVLVFIFLFTCCNVATINAADNDVSFDFSNDQQLSSFTKYKLKDNTSGNVYPTTGVSCEIADGKLKFTSSITDEYGVIYNLATPITNDEIEIEFKAKKAADAIMKLAVNGKGLYCLPHAKNSYASSFLYYPWGQYNMVSKDYAANSTTFNLATTAVTEEATVRLRLDLVHQKVRVFLNGVESSYVLNNAATTAGVSMNTDSGIETLRSIAFTCRSLTAGTQVTAAVDDFKVTSLTTITNNAVTYLTSSLPEKVTTDNVDSILYYAKLVDELKNDGYLTGYTTEINKLIELNNVAKYFNRNILLDGKTGNFTPKDPANYPITYKTEDDALVMDMDTSKCSSKSITNFDTYTASHNFAPTISGVVNVEYQVKRTDLVAGTSMCFNSTSTSYKGNDPTVFTVATFYSNSLKEDDKHSFAVKANKSTHWFTPKNEDIPGIETNFALNSYASVKIQLDFVNHLARVFLDGKEVKFYEHENLKTTGRFLSNVPCTSFAIPADQTGLPRLTFAMSSNTDKSDRTVSIKDLTVTRETEDIEWKIATELPANTDDVELEHEAVITDLLAKYNNLPDTLKPEVENYAALAAAKTTLDEKIAAAKIIQFKVATDNIAQVGQEQRFTFATGVAPTQVLVDGKVLTNGYTATTTGVAISASAFPTAKTYTVAVVIDGAKVACSDTIAEADAVVYGIDGTNVIAQGSNKDIDPIGGDRYTTDFPDVGGFMKSAAIFGPNGNEKIAFIPRLKKGDLSVSKDFFWQWNVTDSGNYEIDFCKIGFQAQQAWDPAPITVEVKDSNGSRYFELNPVKGTDAYETLSTVSDTPSVFTFTGNGEEYVKVSISKNYEDDFAGLDDFGLGIHSTKLRPTYADKKTAEKALLKDTLEAALVNANLDSEETFDNLSNYILNLKGMDATAVDNIAGITAYRNHPFVKVINPRFTQINAKTKTYEIIKAPISDSLESVYHSAVIYNKNVLSSYNGYAYCMALFDESEETLSSVYWLTGNLAANEAAYYGRYAQTANQISVATPTGITLTPRAFLWNLNSLKPLGAKKTEFYPAQ